jgi:glycosyltransferase involved in cell wall biosynthesis
MKVVFADNAMQWDGNTPGNAPLGGSQSACAYLARALADLGHEVVVYSYLPGDPGIIDGVEYRNTPTLPENKDTDVDVFMTIRDPRLAQHWNGSGIRLLKVQDDYNQPLNTLLNEAVPRSLNQHLLYVSDWQMRRAKKNFRLPDRKCSVHRNGIWKPHFSDNFQKPVGNRLVYCSTPFRGLEQLLDIFPLIRKQVPDAELHVYSDMKIYQYNKDQDDNRCGHIYEKLKQGIDGVVNHGSVGQKRLARELEKCKILAYSNTFPETSCIAAMEAQASGCVAVTTRLGALPETVGPHGIFVDGLPGKDDFDERFAKECVTLLSDQERWEARARAAREWILNNNCWSVVAGQFITIVEGLKKGRKKTWTVPGL